MLLHSDYLISEILPAGEIHLLAGPSGAGKTTLLMQILADFLAGVPVWGYRPFPAPVFYVSCDRTLNEQKRVMERTRTGWGAFPVAVVKQIFPGTLRPSIGGIVAYAKKHYPETKLLVVDGFATLVPGGRYMDYTVVSDWLRDIQDLCQASEITILGVVHFAKEKKGEGYSNQRERILGSAAWGAFANLVLTLSKDDPEDPRSRVRNLWVCPRNGEETLHKLEMSKGLLVPYTTLGEDDKSSVLECEIRKLPPDLPFGRKAVKELNDRLAPEVQVSDATLDRLLRQMIEEGKLEKAGYGRYKRVSEA